jgi:hypothetical protein
MHSLFSTKDRTRLTTKRYNESIYRFLNSSAWSSMRLVREFWDGWFSNYDEDRRIALARRFQSFDDHAHLSAFLELFTFAVLKRAGMKVEIEPPIGSFALEFLGHQSDGRELFVECTATGQRTEVVGADAREGELLDAIDGVSTGSFMLTVTFRRRGVQMPPVKMLTGWLESWINGLGDAGGDEVWEHNDWVVHFAAVSGDDEADGGIAMVGPTLTDATVPIARLRSAIDRKASKMENWLNPF